MTERSLGSAEHRDGFDTTADRFAQFHCCLTGIGKLTNDRQPEPSSGIVLPNTPEAIECASALVGT